MNKTIAINLFDTKSIDAAIKAIEQHKKWLTGKCTELRKRIADEICESAQKGFDSAWIDDLIPDGSRKAEVTVTAQDDGKVSIVVASGADAIWAEFGAGITHGGPAGQSKHPKGGELGFTIGSYGKGMGKRRSWRFKENGELKQTRGTAAQQPLYKSVMEVSQRINQIAKEVFGGRVK